MVQTKGFTLIELIIVIALIALLATTVILVINPVKIFEEARDSQRIADLGQINSAISIFLASANPTGAYLANGDAAGCAGKCWTHSSAAGANCGGRNAVAKVTTPVAAADARKVTGAGWVQINLGNTVIPALPVDPKGIADGTNFYAYACDASTWELSANMESVRYASGGTDNVESTDGGNIDTVFEVGPGIGAL